MKSTLHFLIVLVAGSVFLVEPASARLGWFDMAASVQVVTEEIMLAIVRDLHRRTGMRNLCMAGGVALNCVSNGRVVREGPFDNLWVQPAAGDAGGSLGAALFTEHAILGNPRKFQMKHAYWGPAHSDEAIRTELDARGAPIPSYSLGFAKQQAGAEVSSRRPGYTSYCRKNCPPTTCSSERGRRISTTTRAPGV